MLTAKNMTEAKKVVRDALVAEAVNALGLTQFSDNEGAKVFVVTVGEGAEAKEVSLYVGLSVNTKQEKDTKTVKAFDIDKQIADWNERKITKAKAAEAKEAAKATKATKATKAKAE